MENKRITYISLLQIIGPIFVVLGHSLNGLQSTGAWYIFSKEWIYIFHMPLFFLISGYLLSFKGYQGEKSYIKFIFNKSKRLLLPYFIWNIIFWVPKFLFQDYLSDKVSFNVLDILKAFVFPRQNVWGHTWFLVALFIVYLATPLFQKLFETKKVWISTIAIVFCIFLYILPINTEFLALSDLHKDLLFFVIGCLLGQMRSDKFIIVMKRFRLGFICGAILFSIISLIWYEQTKPLHFIPCIFILMTFLSISTSIESLSPFFEKLASFSFGIYIMHWPIMILVRILFYQLLNLSVAITAIAMSILGYLIPVIILIVLRALPFKKIKKPLKYLLGV